MTGDDKIVQLLTEIRDLLVGNRRGVQPASPRQVRRKAKSAKREDSQQVGIATSAVETLLAAKTDAAEWNSVWEGGKPLDKWLAALAIAEEEVAPQTSLSAPEIAEVLEKRFRVGGVHATNVNRDLKKARKYVGRRQRGSGFEYWLTRDGLTHAKERRDKLSNPAR